MPTQVKELKAEIEKTLTTGVSKDRINELVEKCNREPGIFPWLIETALTQKPPFGAKVAWLISHMAINDPKIYNLHSDYILTHIDSAATDGIIRELLRPYTRINLSGFEHGLLLDLCFKFMAQGPRDLAVKYHSMKTAMRLVKIYPELKPELIEILEIQSELDQTTFAGHAKKWLKRI